MKFFRSVRLLLPLCFCLGVVEAGEPLISFETPSALRELIARQLIVSARPAFIGSLEEGFLRFDGKDDFLLLPGTTNAASNLTLFVVAAPRANPGFFSGLFAAAPPGANDYVAGFNVDLGPNATTNLSVVNVESAGAQGAVDLLQPGFVQNGRYPLGGFHVFTVRSQAGAKGVELFIDGILTGTRARAESHIGLDHLVIGARLYSNDGLQNPFIQGFFNGDIAAVQLFTEAVADAEREQIEQKLFARVATLNAIASGEFGHALQTVADPPPVQMLAPDFTVHELPLKISNINNVRYRRDGKLVALGYDGRIHLLSDTDGDGLEDKDEIFWDKPTLRSPIGMALLDDARGDGIFVASKGKVSLILDRDRDGRADEEIVVASGWKEITHNVDTLGLAVDPRDHSIYFSIATENFIDAYLHDGKGGTRYSTNDDRGTIQRVSADFQKREIIATGVRFICGMAFNREGDLFATDQEGATWLPNGNPLDELLQIVRGRHYGFPPRHPKNLPYVIDEPATVEYPPQHQSAVGLTFNESVNGGPAFGPKHWAGDAIVTGESRGKIFKTKLVKTEYGYVGQNQIIACLGLLTIDTCVSPQGDLVVSTHSGPPDWGTGPAGQGRLFKIRYARKDVPQVTAAWAAGPDEFHIAFDRPLNAADWAGAKEKIRIEAGKYVSAGDRFEVIRPGYQVVRDQMSAPRRWVRLESFGLSEDRRNLILRVPRQTERVTYAVTLPTPKSWLAAGGIGQVPEFDVAINFNGAVAREGNRSIVLPHPDLKVARALTAGSVEHERFFAAASAPKVATVINDSNIFVPAIQPGSTLDWDIAHDEFANRKMTVAPDFSFYSLDDRKRPIALRRAFLPWSTLTQEKETNLIARTDVHGNWLHGRRVFFGAATCSTCHTLRGEGTAFGPDLSNLVFRDRDSVYRDIAQPSGAINPDHTGTTLKLKDGSDLSGLVKTMDDHRIVLRLPGALEKTFQRTEVASIEPMKTSLMPEGLATALSKEQMEDLLTFLLTNPLEPTKITRTEPPTPAPRARSEFAGLIALPHENPKPLRLLLCAGAKDHGVDEHDYPVWLARWSRLLGLADNVTIATNMGFPSRDELATADVAIFYSSNPGWNTNSAALLDEFQKRGGGLIYLHYAIEGGKDFNALAERVGASFYISAFRHGEEDLVFQDREHSITKGLPNLHLTDESYWKLHGDPKRLHVLATSLEENQPTPQIWTVERGKSRVVVSIPGHFMWTFDDPIYRILVLRAIAWVAHDADINRFSELTTVGARVAQ